MNRARYSCCFLALLSALPIYCAETTKPPARQGISAYQLILDRNIFNQRRTARNTSQPRRESRRVSRVDSVTLAGIMTYEKGPFAFFDGSRSDHRKALRPGETIAEHKILSISPQHVRLALETNEFDLAVGKQLRREDSGPWHVAEAPERSATTYASSSSSSRATPSAPTAPARPTIANPLPDNGPPPTEPGEGPPMVIIDPDNGVITAEPPPDSLSTNSIAEAPPAGADGDVLRRLMQRREEELNR